MAEKKKVQVTQAMKKDELQGIYDELESAGLNPEWKKYKPDPEDERYIITRKMDISHRAKRRQSIVFSDEFRREYL